MKTNTAAPVLSRFAPAETDLARKAALRRLSTVTAPFPSGSFGFVACRFPWKPEQPPPLRELPARFSFDAKNETEAGEVLAAVLALGYEVKAALFLTEGRGFVPLFLAEPETQAPAEKAPRNRARLDMGRAAPLYTRADTGQTISGEGLKAFLHGAA